MAQKLTDPQKVFAEVLVSQYPRQDLAKAAELAGYSSPEVAGKMLLRKPLVQEYIRYLRYSAEVRNGISINDIVREYARIAFLDIRDLFDENGNLKLIKDLPTDVARAIQSIEIEDTNGHFLLNKKIKVADKLAALKALEQLLGYSVIKERKVKRNAAGDIIETEDTETVSANLHKVIFEDHSHKEENGNNLPVQENL